MNVWNGLYGPEEMILIHYDNDEDFHNFFLAIIIETSTIKTTTTNVFRTESASKSKSV